MATLLYAQDFNAMTVGATPPGWVRAYPGYPTVLGSIVSTGVTGNGFATTDQALYTGIAARENMRFQYTFILRAADMGECACGIMATVPSGEYYPNSRYKFSPNAVWDYTTMGFGMRIYRQISGSSNTQIGSTTAFVISGSPAVGDSITVSAEYYNGVLTYKAWKTGTTEPVSGGTGYYSVTDPSPLGVPGYALLALGYTFDDVAIYNPEETALAPVNTVLPVVSGTPMVGGTLSSTTGTWDNYPTGYGYQWRRGGSDISGATSSTYTQVEADLGLMITCAVTAANAVGSVTAVSAEVGPVTTSTMTTIGVDDPLLLWSPAGWDTLPVGQYDVTVMSKQCGNGGNYLKFKVLNSTEVSLLTDGVLSGSVQVSINGSARTTYSLGGSTSIALLSAATSADRTFELWVYAAETTGRYSTVAGSSISIGVRISGITINAGATLTDWPLTLPKKALMMGASIVDGIAANNGTSDCLASFVHSLAKSLEAEVAQVGMGGQGWSNTGTAGAIFPATWDRFAVDRPRDLTEIDYLVVSHGTNDGVNYSDSATVLAWLVDARTKLGAGKWIFLCTPTGNFARTALLGAMEAYQTAYPDDTYTVLIDSSEILDTMYFSTWYTASIYASDGVHLNQYGHALYAGALAGLINEAMGGEVVEVQGPRSFGYQG